mgnify:CR=1
MEVQVTGFLVIKSPIFRLDLGLVSGEQITQPA